MKKVLIVLSAIMLTGCTSVGFGKFLRAYSETYEEQQRYERSRPVEKKVSTCYFCNGQGWVKCTSADYRCINGVRKCDNCKGTGELTSK